MDKPNSAANPLPTAFLAAEFPLPARPENSIQGIDISIIFWFLKGLFED